MSDQPTSEIKPLDLSHKLSPAVSVGSVKGVKQKIGVYTGAVYLSNFSAGGGCAHLGTFKSLADAALKWDAAKHCFFLLTGQAGKLVDRRQFNSPTVAAKWTVADSKTILGPKLTEKIEELARKWIATEGQINRPWADRASKGEFAERLVLLENKLERLQDKFDRLLKSANLPEPESVSIPETTSGQ